MASEQALKLMVPRDCKMRAFISPAIHRGVAASLHFSSTVSTVFRVVNR
jgi:hypothetical protein